MAEFGDIESLINKNKVKQSQLGSKRFRLQGKNLFFTFPQCQAKKEVVMERIVTYFGKNLEFAIVSEEKHKDGTPHLHVAISLHMRTDQRGEAGMKRMDALTGKHGNYMVARNMKNVVNYVVKDKNYAAHGIDVQLYLKQAQQKKSTRIAIGMMNGKSIHQINQEDPGFVLMNLKNLQNYQEFLEVGKRRDQKPLLESFKATGHQDSGKNILIADWLNKNLFTNQPRKIREKQLYIYGEPGLGKTRLIGLIRDLGIRTYMFPASEKFHDLYDDDAYDLIVFDEFKGQATITDLNKWLDGQQFGVPRKGTSALLKKKNLPFIVLSNFAPEDVYKNCTSQALAPFVNRFDVIEIDEELEINFTGPPATDSTADESLIFSSEEDVIDNGVGVGAFSDEDSEDNCSSTQLILTNVDDKSDYPLTIDDDTLILSGLCPKRTRDDSQFDSQGNYIGCAQPEGRLDHFHNKKQKLFFDMSDTNENETWFDNLIEYTDSDSSIDFFSNSPF